LDELPKGAATGAGGGEAKKQEKKEDNSMVKLTAEELMEAKKGARDLDDVLMKRPKMFDDEPG